MALRAMARAWPRRLPSRFAAVRVRPAQRDARRSEERDARRSEARNEHWLLVGWPHHAAEATKFWLSTLPEETPITDLVHLAKQRWLIERDYRELKQELGLGHYERRGWRGFQHHAALSIASLGSWSPNGRPGPVGASSGRLGPGGCRSRPSATPRLPQCVQSGMCRTRSLRCEGASRTRSLMYRPWILRHPIAIKRPSASCPSCRVGTGPGSDGRAARSASFRCRSA
jgi:hypothetical protein